MRGTLTFTRPADVIADDERPGLLRARLAEEGNPGDPHLCELRDLSVDGAPEPRLRSAGFQTVDLAENHALQTVLAEVRAADEITESSNEAIRASLNGTEMSLGGGEVLRVDFVVDDGLFHRRSGPNGLDVNPGGIDGFNGHGGAQFVHGDQDVFGTPLRQLLEGAAPDMFRHVTPDGRNDEASTCLLNLWIPLHAPVQPLALMDRTTLDAPRHQLRYGLPVDGFLDRDDDAGVNDIWNFLYDPDQRWHVWPDMTSDRGYIFDTLGTGHGAAVLAGEDALEAHYLALGRLCQAHDRGDADAWRALAAEPPTLRPPADATPTILAAADAMAALMEEAAETEPAGPAAGLWCQRARAAMDAVIRRSVELRLVATLVNAD